MQHKKKFFFGFFKKFGIFWEIIQLSVFNAFFIKHGKCTAEKIEKTSALANINKTARIKVKLRMFKMFDCL